MSAEHGEFDAAEVMHDELFETGRNSTCLLEPADAALDDVAPAVLLSIEVRRPPGSALNLVAPLGDHGTYPMSAQPLSDAPMAVALVAGLLGSLSGAPAGAIDAHRVKQRFCIQGLVGSISTELHRQGQPCTVSEQVQLGAPAAAAAPGRVVLRFLQGQVFLPLRLPPCAPARWSRQCTTTTSQCRLGRPFCAAAPPAGGPTDLSETSADSVSKRSVRARSARASRARAHRCRCRTASR